MLPVVYQKKAVAPAEWEDRGYKGEAKQNAGCRMQDIVQELWPEERQGSEMSGAKSPYCTAETDITFEQSEPELYKYK